MKIYKHFDEKGLSKIVNRWSEESFIFLHHTGYMFGMGCRIDDKKGLDKLCELKQRDNGKGFVILIPGFHTISMNQNRLTEYPTEINPIDLELDSASLSLIEQYFPGNLTLCLKHRREENLAGLSVEGKIAIRIPEDPLLCAFIDKLGVPIVSTSVNSTGEQPLDNLQEISKLDWFDFALLSDEHKRNLNYPSTIVAPEGKNLVCHREGSIPFEEIESSYHKPLILFVCTGNICRSPLAEYYTRHIIKEAKLPYRTESAGFIQDKVTISANSYSVLIREGIEVDKHYSQAISYEILRKAWLILTMEEGHREAIHDSFPAIKHKVFTLSEFVGFTGDVEDPYQSNLEVYESTYSLIKRYCNILVKKLQLRQSKPIFISKLAKESVKDNKDD